MPRLSTEASEFFEGLGRELWVRELLRVHHLFQQRIAELRRGSVGIYLACEVVLCLFERYQLQMLRLQHVKELRQDRAAERAEMQQEDVINIVSVDELSHGAITIDVIRRDAQVIRDEPLDRSGVVLCRAAGVGTVPGVVLIIDRNLCDFVSVIAYVRSDCAALIDGVAFAEKRI